jgi:osmotically-inducible protein OsmY
MRLDNEIRHDVEQELCADPALDAADIAVAVHEGVVSLTGFVRFYRHKRRAEDAAKRVAGVTGVANDIEVRLPILHQRPDPAIARDAVAALMQGLPDAAEHIQVSVRNGWVTLEGEVEWNFEREEAKSQVEPVRGVVGVTNSIRIRPKVAADDVQAAIAHAFLRAAQIDASQISVEVKGDQVTLRGTVRSWAESEEAERTAWRVPSVAWVDNQISVTD